MPREESSFDAIVIGSGMTGGFAAKALLEVAGAPGNANHEMGTARMGRDPRTSVLNAFNQTWEFRTSS